MNCCSATVCIAVKEADSRARGLESPMLQRKNGAICWFEPASFRVMHTIALQQSIEIIFSQSKIDAALQEQWSCVAGIDRGRVSIANEQPFLIHNSVYASLTCGT